MLLVDHVQQTSKLFNCGSRRDRLHVMHLQPLRVCIHDYKEHFPFVKPCIINADSLPRDRSPGTTMRLTFAAALHLLHKQKIHARLPYKTSCQCFHARFARVGLMQLGKYFRSSLWGYNHSGTPKIHSHLLRSIYFAWCSKGLALQSCFWFAILLR